MKRILWLLIPLLALYGSCKTTNKQTSTQTPPGSALNICGATVADLNTEPGYDGRLTPLFEGLDVYSYPISTKSKLAQRYFDQGFVLNYGFNHAEAARSFREAIRQDSECAMCYWGLSYVLGPNYNAGMQEDVLTPANEAIANAQLYMHKASAKEQALIKALAKRYPKQKDIDPQPYYESYAEAMKEVMQHYPDDVDIASMTAEALMDLHPWQIWTKAGEPQPWTQEILDIVEQALNLNPNHPQAIHLYIHAMEASANPEKALEATNRLRFMVPGSGHLLHMPSHLYINTGHYHEGTLANERAVKVDSTYVAGCHAAGIYPLGYYPHNWHFLAACAALEGQGERAIEASRYMSDYTVDKEMMYLPDLASLQHYYSIPWYVMVKFAKWDDILNEPQPDEKLIYPNVVWHYARGMAFAGKGNVAKAEAELAAIKILEQDTFVQNLVLWDINKASDLVAIAKYVVEGEIAHRKGGYETAIISLRKAVEIEDQLNYNEPPDWFFSVRHILGDVLLKAEKYAEAQQVYEEDLNELKENGWALMGLYKTLLKQGKKSEAEAVKKRFDKAWAYADVELTSSVI